MINIIKLLNPAACINNVTMHSDIITYKMFKVLFVLALFLPLSAITQVNWTSYPEPVLSMNPSSGMWGAYGQASVMFFNDTIRMWYAVAEGDNPSDTVLKGRIHYAWSLDGISWVKHSNNPVFNVGGTGEWDGQWLDTPDVLWDGSEFKMYYYGDSTSFQGQDNTALGLATSPDGIHWTRQGKVLEKGAPGDWDGKFIESPAAYFDPVEGLYYMLYSGIDTVGFAKIGLAASFNGYNWIKFPQGAPVLSVGNYPSWNDIGVAYPSLMVTNGIAEMWYSGISFDNGQYDSARVGYAVSINGIDWIEYQGNPVLYNQGNTSNFGAVDVFFDSIANEYKMYYEDFWTYDTVNNNKVNAIFYATAPRDVFSSSQCNTSVTNDTIICLGSMVQLYASGGTSYSWDPPEGLSSTHIANPIAAPDTTTTYHVLIVSDSCITTDTVTVTVLPVGINDLLSGYEKLYIYPNPSKGTFSLNIPDEEQGRHSQIYIYNRMGALVWQSETDNQTVQIDMSRFAEGIYVVRVFNKGKAFMERIVIL